MNFLRSAVALVFALLLSTSADALLFRAYLASDGNDVNPCTLPSPCRLLPAALAAVADGGEIWMLDSANYNTTTVTIGKSVSVLAIPGAVGSVVAVGGSAINITASGLVVSLRNLLIEPLPGGGGVNGIMMTGASSLNIADSLLAGHSGAAIRVTGTGKVKVANSVLQNSINGVFLEEGATADIASTKLFGHGNIAVIAQSFTATTTTATLSDSVISDANAGVFTITGIAGAVARIAVTRCTISNTPAALDAEGDLGSASVSVSASTIVNNTNAWYVGGLGATIRTLGNNHFTENAGAHGVMTLVPLQ